MALVGQTITVVNKSGKIVSTSKHLVNIFKEAKSAYLERKAELKCSKDGTAKSHPEVTLPSRPFITYDSEERSQSGHHSTKDPSHPQRTSKRRKSHDDRKQVARKASQQAGTRRTESAHAKELQRANTETQAVQASQKQENKASGGIERSEVVRRNSDSETLLAPQPVKSKVGQPSVSVTEVHAEPVDMDLAYGELPPPVPQTRAQDENAVRNKMSTLNRMLEELNCLQFSATRIIKSLEANPEAMAAVALTLAEISNLASKLGPSVLASLRGSFPAVVALLASPEFLIAAGVGVGITIVALGGYKIIKKIKPTPIEATPVEAAPQPAALEQLVTSDIDRIEHWRRGIAATETGSVGTSVEGELMTPMAAMRLREENVLPAQRDGTSRRDKFRGPRAPSSRSVASTAKTSAKDDKRKVRRHERDDEQNTTSTADSTSEQSRRQRRSKSDAASSKSERVGSRNESLALKKKEPSGLRLLFKKRQ